VGNTARPDAAPAIPGILLGALAALLETCALAGLLLGAPSPGLGIHGLASAAAAGAAALLVPISSPVSRAQMGALVGAFVLLLPGYGLAILACLLASLRFIPPPPGDLLAEFVEHTAPTDGGGPKRRMRAGDIPLVEHLQVEPLIDMLDTPDVDLKSAVIDAMAKRRSAKMVACIQGCLTDPRPEVYQYAMAKLGRLQEEFTRDIGEATAAVQAATDAAEPHYRLAALYEEYLASGLVDETLVAFYRGLLEKEYRAVLARSPFDTTATLALGRVLLEMEQTDEAAVHFRSVLDRDPACIEARFGMVAVHYAEREWGSMQREVENVLALGATRTQSQSDVLELAQWLRGEELAAELPSSPTARVLRVPATMLRMPGAAPPSRAPAGRLQIPPTVRIMPVAVGRPQMRPAVGVASSLGPGAGGP